MHNIDKVKKALLPNVLETMRKCNKAQLERWYRDLNKEIETEGTKTERAYMLKNEKIMIEYLLF